MLHPKHKEWLEKRGIQSDTAEGMEVSTRADERGNWLVFPYRLRGEIVNRKYRMTSDKKHEMDKGGRLCLWNADCLQSPRAEQALVITEGEFDAMIAMQCGHALSVSVPNGTSSSGKGDPLASNAYQYLWESHAQLEKIKTIVLATDGDEPGRALAHDLASILGPERCRFVTYPEGCKDLNETFLQWGLSAVTHAITTAKPYPVQGLYSFSDFPDAPPVRAMGTGIRALDPMLQIVPATLTIFTGFANMGKTTVIDTMVANCVAQNVSVCVASFETLPKPIMRDDLARALIGCSKDDLAKHPQRQAAYETLEEKVKIVSNALDENLEFDIESFLETVRVSVLRDGVRVVILDPWNELEHKRNRDESLTEYVGRAIRRVKAFARQHNVAFWIVAHPTKPQKGVNQMPSLYDVSDSANWSNKADYGLVYHRADKTVNDGQIAVVKVRKGLPGYCGIANVYFDDSTSRIAGYGPQ